MRKATIAFFIGKGNDQQVSGGTRKQERGKDMDVSRSEQKRRIKRLEEMVIEIAGLSAGDIAKLPCSGEVRQLFHEAASMKGGARKRQLKYITKLLREEPVDELYTFVTNRKGAALQETKEFHELEFYRDALLNEAIGLNEDEEEHGTGLGEEWPSRVVDEIFEVLPDIDRQALLRLSASFARTRNRRYSRELFRLLRAAHDQNKRNKRQQGV